MAGQWVTITHEDKTEPYKMEPHKIIYPKYSHWPMCQYCGLIFLKNDITRWSIKMGCDHKNHPQFEKKLEQYTKR